MKLLRAFLWVSILLSLSMIGNRPLYADCSGNACSECGKDSSGLALCSTVSKSASCECTISVSNPYTCTVKGACTYSSGGGGGTGGGGGGSGECTRTAGEWCPADCSSCTTVYWY